MCSDRCSGEIVHIGNSTQEVRIIDLLQKVFDIADYHPAVDVQPAPEGCVMRRCPNTDKLSALTGFRASITLDEALPRMYRWYMQRYAEMEQKL